MKLPALFTVIAAICMAAPVTAQNDSVKVIDARRIGPQFVTLRPGTPISLSGYIDTYYARYSTETDDGANSQWPGVNGQGGKIGINTAQITASSYGSRTRGQVTLWAGDIARFTWPDNDMLRFIHEAYAGLKLQDKLWLEAGIFAPHLGTESLLPRDNFLSTISIGTWMEPFVQAGAKLLWDPHKNWHLELHAVNGFGEITGRVNQIAPGAKVEWQASKRTRLGYSNIWAERGWQRYNSSGQVVVTNIDRNLFYQNAWLSHAGNGWELLTGASFGWQEDSHPDPDRSEGGWTANFLVSGQVRLHDKWDAAGRVEVFNDPHGLLSRDIVVDDGEFQGLDLSGLTLGVSYKPVPAAYLRLEWRTLVAINDREPFTDEWFGDDNASSIQRHQISLNLGVSFGRNAPSGGN